MTNDDMVTSVYYDDVLTNMKDTPTKITNYFSRMADDVIEITTKSGKQIKCTKDHPILTSNEVNGSYDALMKDAGILKLSDHLVVRCTNSIDLMKEVNNGSVVLNNNFVAAKIESIKDIDPQIVYDFTTVESTH